VIEMGKEYRTRLGERVKLVTVSGCSDTHPVIGEFLGDSAWFVMSWTKDGCAVAGELSVRDLIEVKPVLVLEGWINVDKAGVTGFFFSRENADQFAYDNRIACVHIRQEYKEGDGLCDSEKT